MSILEMDKLSCRHLVMTSVVMTNEKRTERKRGEEELEKGVDLRKTREKAARRWEEGATDT